VVSRVTETPITLSVQSDICQPFLIFGGAFRGRLVRLTASVTEILNRHNDPTPVASLLAEAMVSAVALAGGLKFNGVFTLQVQSDGPISTLVADITTTGDLRAWAKFDHARLDAALRAPRAPGQSPRLMGKGHLAFTVDQGPDTERYQGIVELAGGGMADSVHQYFRQSEQLASALKIAVGHHHDGKGDIWTAAALLLQRMPQEGGSDRPTSTPEEDEDAWRTAVILLGSVKDSELLDPSLASERLLYRLYGTVGVRGLPPRPIRAACRCSAARSLGIMASFPLAEVREFATDGKVAMTCEFCREVFSFTLDEIASAAESRNSAGKEST